MTARETLKASPLDRPNSAQGRERLGSSLDNGSLRTQGVCRMSGPLSDQHGFDSRGIPTDLVFDHCIIIQARDEGLHCLHMDRSVHDHSPNIFCE